MSFSLNSPSLVKVLDGYDASSGIDNLAYNAPGAWTMGYGSQAMCVQFVSSGNLVGTVDVEGSLDGIHFYTVTLSNDANRNVNVSSTPTNMFNFFGSAIKYFRVKFVKTSGTGNISVWVSST